MGTSRTAMRANIVRHRYTVVLLELGAVGWLWCHRRSLLGQASSAQRAKHQVRRITQVC
jgi:hypothetical protein